MYYHVVSLRQSRQRLNLRIAYYHAMTFWNFSALSFVSLDTKGYQPRTFSGSCLNCPIHILWCLFKWNLIWGSRGRKGYHLLKECHGMSRIGCDGSLPNSISDDTIGNWNHGHWVQTRKFKLHSQDAVCWLIQDICITSWNLLKFDAIALKHGLNFFRRVWYDGIYRGPNFHIWGLRFWWHSHSVNWQPPSQIFPQQNLNITASN